MISAIKSMLGFGPAVDWAALVAAGAEIIDVRSKGEFLGGHIKHSVNIPLSELGNHLSKIKKDSIIITCCASGMRSASAKNMLAANGFTKVYNGGGWMTLQNKIR
ncbi:rhodanese-like domain-containing protein [Agriterribacter sp.]|uniref:rhodanese-like domain-containing protein n=1 Tax=Agriterribacter sp. TaxID=2821509 RepID=UPI002C3272FB|nr:rhodanese-like domain-containing protein [Agriterribacter sp.]HRO44731.1 rhodanese-like domain-containing protein [Agriterribacter sp.]HRQ16404.1 rhodanese-like domain-containing protein [Agriterribacter sp.]